MTHMSRSARERSNSTASRAPQTSGKGTGGREFGQVIEPMQAQMASGNEGLADSSGQKQSAAGKKRSGNRSKRKAA
jgi:hypothetical protein